MRFLTKRLQKKSQAFFDFCCRALRSLALKANLLWQAMRPAWALLASLGGKTPESGAWPRFARLFWMHHSLLGIFQSFRFHGPQKPPIRWDKAEPAPQKLLTRDFFLLFIMAMCSNGYIAVYYCFEQWMQGLGIEPQWRGLLLSSLFAMILIFRPLTSVVLLKRSKLGAMILSLTVMSLVMLAYPAVSPAGAVGTILVLRLVQGIALAVFSCCTVAILVDCIPPGQSARGFALFSLTLLLPYSIIPAVSENLIPLLGGEARLFAATSVLGVPAFAMICLLARRLRTPEVPPQNASMGRKELWHAITHSGLAFVYLACLSFSITTVLAIFFMKGLCAITGAHPAWFFSTYTITIILVRLFGSQYLDSFPRYLVTTLCAGALSLIMLGFALGPLWSFVPLACLYGLGLGLLYPLLAATVYDRSRPELRSVNSNVMMASFDASGMLAPMIGGFVLQAGCGYQGVFMAAGASMACCGLSMIIDRARLLASEKEGRNERAGS